MLRLSIDEPEDEDVRAEAEGFTFVLSRELADQYGSEFTVSRDENDMFLVTAKGWKCTDGTPRRKF